MARLFDGEVHVAYSQMSVETPDVVPDGEVERFFAGQTNGLCGAAEPGLLFCRSGLHTGWVPVTVDLFEAEPALDSTWDEIVEVSLTTTATTMLLCGWADPAPVALALGDGPFRVRFHAHNMQAGRDADVRRADDPVLDRYLLQFWPAAPEPDTVRRQTSPVATYWHGVARSTPHSAALDAQASKEQDQRRAFEATREAITASSIETQRAAARWLGQRAIQLAGPATTAWAGPALEALAHDQPLPPPFDDWQQALAAAQTELPAAPPSSERQDHAQPQPTPWTTMYALRALCATRDPDARTAFTEALTMTQLVDDTQRAQLLADLREAFLR